jgi:Tfp pilus assembly protein PilF
MDKTTRAYRRLSLLVAWAAALGFAGAAMVTKWLNFPLSKQLRGMDFALGPYAEGPQHPHLLSFGVIAAGLLLAGALAYTLRWWRALGWTGVLLLWLAVLAPLKATMLDAGLLQTLAVEASQQQLAAAFTQAVLPVNFGSEPTQDSRLDLNTVEDRLVAAWEFAHGGWWAVLCGGLLAVACGTGEGFETNPVAMGRWPMRGRAWIPIFAIAGVFGILVLCCLRPGLAESALMDAHTSEARGDLDGAEKAYRQAMRLDEWQRLDIDNYSALGCLDEARGHRDTPEYRVYHAQLPSTQVDLMASVGELEMARTDDTAFLAVVRRREAELYTQYARQLYGLQAYGAAATASENALERDPHSLLAQYYLARDYFMIGRYSDAGALSMKLATALSDPTFRANLFSDAGDAYTRLGNYNEAKVAYRLSYKYDYVLNLRGLAALNGPGEDLQ